MPTQATDRAERSRTAVRVTALALAALTLPINLLAIRRTPPPSGKPITVWAGTGLLELAQQQRSVVEAYELPIRLANEGVTTLTMPEAYIAADALDGLGDIELIIGPASLDPEQLAVEGTGQRGTFQSGESLYGYLIIDSEEPHRVAELRDGVLVIGPANES